MSKDMEMFCDEAVLRNMNKDAKSDIQLLIVLVFK